MISIQCIDLKKPRFLSLNQLKSFLKELIRLEGKRVGDVSIVLCDDTYLLKVNQDYLNHDFFTDIITFDYCEESLISGDLLISMERVKENSEMLGVSFESEFYRVVFHGVLHLCGYKDKNSSDIKEMRSKENEYLSLFHVKQTNN